MRILGDFHQIGIVVPDIDKGMAHYREMMGLGPFMRVDTDYEGRYRDWRGRIANSNAFTRWGNIYLEMVAPGIGQSNAKEWLDQRGPGIFHMGYTVDDLSVRPGGVECVFESWGATLPDGGAAVIHLDTVATLGYFLELSHRSVADQLNARIDAFLAHQSGSLRV